jgi:hypothetical protein
MTASFAFGQMIGPSVAGYLFDSLGSLRVPSLVAAGALVVAAVLAAVAGRAVSAGNSSIACLGTGAES